MARKPRNIEWVDARGPRQDGLPGTRRHLQVTFDLEPTAEGEPHEVVYVLPDDYDGSIVEALGIDPTAEPHSSEVLDAWLAELNDRGEDGRLIAQSHRVDRAFLAELRAWVPPPDTPRDRATIAERITARSAPALTEAEQEARDA